MNLYDFFTEDAGNDFILYFNGKPVATYTNVNDAEYQARQVKAKHPDLQYEIKKEVCTLTPVELKENLHQWFKEKWVRFGPDGKIRGDCARGDDSEGKPKCLPQAKAHALGKKGRKYAASKKRREDPNPERRGPAKNVATKKKSNEGIAEADNQSSAKTGIYQTDVFGAKAYHAKCMEPNCDWESKRFDKIKQAQAAAEKHAKSHFKQGVAEGIETVYGKKYDVDPNKYYVWAWDGAVVLYGEYDNVEDAKMNLPKLEKKAIERLGPYVKDAFELSTGKDLLHRYGKKGVAEGLDNDESVLSHFAEVLANELGYDADEVADSIVSEMTTPSGIEVYSFTDDDQTYYMGVLRQGKGSAIVSVSHAGGGQDNELEIYGPGENLKYVVKYGRTTPTLHTPDNKAIAQAKPGQDENDLVGVALDMLWGRMQQRFMKSGVAEQELDEACWKGYHKEGMKTMFGKKYPNCVKNTNEEQELEEKWSQKYKSSINCSNPKGFSQKAHCAGRKKNEDVDESAEIRSIQNYLNKKYRANLDVDGEMGPLTKKTIKKFMPKTDKQLAPEPNKTTRVQGKQIKNEQRMQCPECGGPMFSDLMLAEKQDACYHKVKSRYKVWPSAYASGALVQCRKKGAANWGNKSESVNEMDKSQKGAPGWNISNDEPGGKQIHLGPKHMMKGKDVAKKAGKALDKAFDKAHSKKKVKESATCSMTEEGAMCPVHGLHECPTGMMQEAVSGLELAEVLLNGFEQKYPDLFKTLDRKDVENTIMDAVEMAGDVDSMSDIDMMIDDLAMEFNEPDGPDQTIDTIKETKLYYNVVGTPDQQLRQDFRMRKDSRGWYLNEDVEIRHLMTAFRAFGEPTRL